MSARRTDKLSAELQRAVQRVIVKGLSDPRARGLITVTGVEVAKDLRDATVRVSVLPHEHEKLTLHALKDAARHIRREAAEHVAMHRLPEFHFKLDASMKKQAEVIEALAHENRSRIADSGTFGSERTDPDDDTRGRAAEGSHP